MISIKASSVAPTPNGIDGAYFALLYHEQRDLSSEVAKIQSAVIDKADRMCYNLFNSTERIMNYDIYVFSRRI